MKALNRLTTRRFPATDVYTIDQARELSLLSRALGRQLGMLIDRKGRVDMVLVGEAGGILIPELPRARSGADRLRGLRLLHTHLTPDGLSQEDLMDLLFLRLDAIIVLTVNPDGDPVQWQEAHLLPTPVAGQPYRVEQFRPWDQTGAHFAATAEALEEELARLKSERPAIIQAIKEAREEGDLRENAGYDAARERQGMAEARIKYIESRMALYQVVDLDKLSGDKVIFGSTVEVEDVDTEESRTYTILGPDEAEPAKGSISFLSPVGQALLGKEVGDEVSVDIPRGRVTYEIVDITFRGSSIFD